MAKQYNIPNLPKDYSDASQIEKWMSGIQKLFQSKNDADNKKEIEIENSINSSACTEDAVKDILNASGSAPIYACRAWVNFNGIGTVAIRASGNVSSITDNGTGDYTANFTTAMEDVNYSFQIIAAAAWSISVYSQTTTSLRFGTQANTTYFIDYSKINIAIFR